MKMNQIVARAIRNISVNTVANLKKGFFAAVESTKETFGYAYVGYLIGAVPVMMIVNLFGLLANGEVYPAEMHKEVILPALLFILFVITMVRWFCKELDIAVAELQNESQKTSLGMKFRSQTFCVIFKGLYAKNIIKNYII